MIYLKALIRWIFSKDTFSNCLFALRIAKSIFTNDNAKNLKKNQAALRKIEIATDALDWVNKHLPNGTTEKYVKGINESEDEKTWGPFNAAVAKGKHGGGKDGVDLGMTTRIGKLPFSIKYRPKDGSAAGSIGPFGFNFK